MFCFGDGSRRHGQTGGRCIHTTQKTVAGIAGTGSSRRSRTTTGSTVVIEEKRAIVGRQFDTCIITIIISCPQGRRSTRQIVHFDGRAAARSIVVGILVLLLQLTHRIRILRREGIVKGISGGWIGGSILLFGPHPRWSLVHDFAASRSIGPSRMTIRFVVKGFSFGLLSFQVIANAFAVIIGLALASTRQGSGDAGLLIVTEQCFTSTAAFGSFLAVLPISTTSRK